MIDTVLLKSGDIYFDKSAEGCNSTLPPGTSQWLNDQILVMIQAIADLDAKVPKDGRDGRDLQMTVGIWPLDAPDLPENRAILWRVVGRDAAEQDKLPWQFLIYEKEVMGPEGPQGPAGHDGDPGPEGAPGKSVQFQGMVNYVSDLVHQTAAKKGDGYIIKGTKDLYVLTEDPYSVARNWLNVGKISGEKGDPGPRGKTGSRGPKGDKGESGGVSALVMDFIISTITSTVVGYVTSDVNSTINAAIDTMANQLANLAEDAAEAAVEKAMDEMMDEFKGEKGDKGDKGDDGKNGTSFNLVGQWNTQGEFALRYPLQADNVGKAALIGDGSTPRDLWIISQLRVTPSVQYAYQNMGPMQGPKGEDAQWDISVRDEHFVEKIAVEVVSDLPSGVPGMYIGDTDSIIVEGISGTPQDPKQVGLKFNMKYPIPTIVPDTGGIGTPTKGKVLSNDGDKLVWADGGTGGSSAKDAILIKGSDLRIWELVVDDEGNLTQQLSTETTDDVMLQLKSPSGRKFGLTVNNDGRMVISEVF